MCGKSQCAIYVQCKACQIDKRWTPLDLEFIACALQDVSKEDKSNFSCLWMSRGDFHLRPAVITSTSQCCSGKWNMWNIRALKSSVAIKVAAALQTELILLVHLTFICNHNCLLIPLWKLPYNTNKVAIGCQVETKTCRWKRDKTKCYKSFYN